jgi:phosphate transport system protein
VEDLASGEGRTAFQQELQQLKATLRQLGECGAGMLEDAMKALVNQDYDLAEDVRKRDNQADALDRRVDDDTMSLLALQAPVAGDLRMVLGAARMATDLERVADYAKDVAKVARKLHREKYYWALEDIPAMAMCCVKMTRLVLDALDDEDPDAAIEVARMDHDVDARWKLLRDQLVEHMESDPRHVRQAARLLLVARYLERVGDHLVNVAERVHHIATGQFRSLDDA